MAEISISSEKLKINTFVAADGRRVVRVLRNVGSASRRRFRPVWKASEAADQPGWIAILHAAIEARELGAMCLDYCRDHGYPH